MRQSCETFIIQLYYQINIQITIHYINIRLFVFLHEINEEGEKEEKVKECVIWYNIQNIYKMDAPVITFEFQIENCQTKTFEFDSKILTYNIEYLANNHNQPYPLPKNIIKSLKPLEVMKQFVIAHNYSAQTIKINKPLNSSNYAEVVDPITFSIFSKYSDQKNADQAVQLIKLGEYIRFHEFSDAVSAAVGVNYFIGEDEKALDQYIKKNSLEVGNEQISEIMKLYEGPFLMISHKARQQIAKVQEGELVQEN